MATEDPLSGLSHEERAALAELAQARVDGRMSRREALATGGLLAGSAGLTLGGILGSTQSASADASTTDADGDIGTPTDRVDVFADGVDSVSASIDELNSNFINLTSLVEDGTYGDIVEAIVKEPANHPNGIYFYIEPGSYNVSTGWTLTESFFKVGCPGYSENWNSGLTDTRTPIEIVWTGGSTTDMLTIGDGTTECSGVGFENITFRPDTSGGGRNAIFGGGASGAPVRDIHFENCMFKSWGGNTFDVNSKIDNFGWRFTHCGFQAMNGAVLGNMVSMEDPYFLLNSGQTLELGRRATIERCILDTSTSDAIGPKLGTPGYINFKNAEGPGSASTAVAMQVYQNVKGYVHVTGGIQGWDVGVQAPTDGAVLGEATMTSIGSWRYDFQGAANNHNGTYLSGDLNPASGVNFANQTQRARVQTSSYVSNISASDLPPGTIVKDLDRDGAGTRSLLIGQDNSDITARYINFDGSV